MSQVERVSQKLKQLFKASAPERVRTLGLRSVSTTAMDLYRLVTRSVDGAGEVQQGAGGDERANLHKQAIGVTGPASSDVQRPFSEVKSQLPGEVSDGLEPQRSVNAHANTPIEPVVPNPPLPESLVPEASYIMLRTDPVRLQRELSDRRLFGNRKSDRLVTERKIGEGITPIPVQAYSVNEFTALIKETYSTPLQAGDTMFVKWSIDEHRQALMVPRFVVKEDLTYEVAHSLVCSSAYDAGRAILLIGDDTLYVVHMSDNSGHFRTGEKSIFVGRELFSSNGFVLATLNDTLDAKGVAIAQWHYSLLKNHFWRLELLPLNVDGFPLDLHTMSPTRVQNSAKELYMQGRCELRILEHQLTATSLEIHSAVGEPARRWEQAKQVFIDNGLSVRV